MKKQCKKIRCWSQDRPLEVVANTNPTIAPMGESPIAQFHCLRIFINEFLS